MTAVVVDTNVLVSLFLKRNVEQQRLARGLFEAADADGAVLYLPQIALADLVFVLSGLYERTAGETHEILLDLLSHPGVSPVNDLPWPRLLELWPKELPDFADAALAAVAEARRVEVVATFDRPLVRKLRKLGLRSYWA